MNGKTRWGLALAVALALGGYLAVAARTYRLGFPLDDAWIFQTYARNLAMGKGWVYVPGRPSAGATAPLWVMLQVPGVWLRMAPLAWPWLWGGGALLGLAWLGAAAWTHWAPPEARSWAWAAGLLLAWEWHLVWAALSGMETLLFTLGALSVVFGATFAAQTERVSEARWGTLGLLVGVLIWLRPEAILLLVAIGWAVLVRYRRHRKAVLPVMLSIGVGVAFPLALYLGFNRALGGAWWPNTFYAKQTEYAMLAATPWWTRAARVLTPVLVGAAALTMPGLLLGAWVAVRQRRWAWFAGPLWALTHWVVYTWRLPVGYQHGRYALPTLPIWLLWGLWGLAYAWARQRHRLWLRAWWFSVLGLTLGFLPLGAQAYARDVAVIESQMVETARWVATHTGPTEVVAAHDIGALGYFAQRPLVDLAGLVSPEVIPYLGNPAALATWVREQRPKVLVAFVGDYPALERDCVVVFRAEGKWVALFSHPPMQVCRFR